MVVLSSPIALVQSVPPVTRAFTAFTVISSATYGYLWWKNLELEAVLYLTLVPGGAIYAPWTFLTSAFVETTIFEFVVSLIFVPAALKYFERLWGTFETAKFITISIVASNIITVGLNVIEFIVTRNAELFLNGMHYHGQMALQVALLVAFTQLIPEHQVQFFGVIKARVKVAAILTDAVSVINIVTYFQSLPMAYLTLSTVLCIIGYQCPWVLVQFGWFVSWVYLRFYKKNPGESLGGQDTYGDRSETFSLVSWFPPFIHYPVTILGNFVYTWANRLHLIPSSSGSDVELGGYGQLPGTTRAEAERRRALALKALDQRLANNSSPSASNSTNPPQQSRSSLTLGRADRASPPPNTNGGPISSNNNASEEIKRPAIDV